MNSERAVLRVVDSIYEAAQEPRQWREVLRQLNELLQGTHSALFLQDREKNRATLGAFVWDPAFMRLYADYYAALNPWLTPRHRRMVHLGSSHTSEMMLPDRELVRTEFYADFMRKQDIHHMIGACVYEEGAVVGNVTILRSKNADAFDDEEMQLLRLLIPHVTRALQLQERLETACSQRDAGLHTIDRFRAAVFMVDDAGRVASMNAAARRLIDANNTVTISASELRLPRAVATAQLRRLLFDAIAAGTNCNSRGGGTMRVERANGPPLEVLVCTLPTTFSFMAARKPAVAVFIDDGVTTFDHALDSWRTLYGLTATEALVASHAMNGLATRDIASSLRSSTNTVKTHMKAVFAKTDVHSRAELLRRLGGGGLSAIRPQ